MNYEEQLKQFYQPLFERNVSVQGRGGVFRDMLKVIDAKVLFSYTDRFYKEYAAVETIESPEVGSFY